MSRKAFTLIELLVVIAIIAILAAILFPVFAQAKQSAKQTSSLSQVKQLLTGEMIYNGDYDDRQVPYVWNNRGDGEWITWQEVIDPYVKNKDIHVHSAASTEKSTYTTGCTSPAGAKAVSHYTMPLWVYYNYWNWFGTVMFAGFPVEPSPENGFCATINPWAACRGMTMVDEPANSTVLVPGYMITYPRTQSKFGWPCTTGFSPYHGKPDPVNTQIQVFREGGNNGFADGHAKYFSSKAMNGNASRPHQYAGGTYPSSPYMVILQ
jgi:prepilin-type N-terminal cleavage/methylation domain-containing protein